MIYYLGYYKSEFINDVKESGSNASSFKMGYVVRLLKSLDESITVVSWCPSDKNGYTRLREIRIDEKQKEVYLPPLRFKKVPMRITAWFRDRALVKFLQKTLKKEDTLIVYHAPSISDAVIKAKNKIGFNLVLEIEEIYWVDKKVANPEKVRKTEEKIINVADSYIIVNDLIYDKYINNGKPYMVLYGVYDNNCLAEEPKKNNLQTQLLFAGSIDRVRGVQLATEVARCLTDDYRLNICGAGNIRDKEELLKTIKDYKEAQRGCEIVYHGELSENQLNSLALSCDIGLVLQDVNNPFEAVSFPSKITFYLQHKLSVVSTKMSSVVNSKLANCVELVDYDAKKIAEKIVEMASSNRKNTQVNVLDNLDRLARQSLKALLKVEKE